MRPKVSIITPCLNSEKTIRDTIESVLQQSYTNIEYIIVDGKSTDSTLSIIQEYMPLFRGRLKYVSEADKGIYNAMNKGIRLSTGQVIGIINSDDYYEKDAVEKIVQRYVAGKYQVIYGQLCVLTQYGGRYICKDSHKQLLKRMIPHPTCFVTRNVYRDFGLYLESLKLAADYELMLRLNKSGRIEFVSLNDTLANFRLGGASKHRRMRFETDFIRFWYGGLSGKELIEKLVEDIFVG